MKMAAHRDTPNGNVHPPAESPYESMASISLLVVAHNYALNQLHIMRSSQTGPPQRPAHSIGPPVILFAHLNFDFWRRP